MPIHDSMIYFNQYHWVVKNTKQLPTDIMNAAQKHL